MNTREPHKASAYDKCTIEKTLEQYDPEIVRHARRVVLRNYSHLVSPESLAFLVDEVSQNTRIKLWQALEVRTVDCFPAYIRRIAFHEFITIMRQGKRWQQLATNEDGEIFYGKVLVEVGEGMDDPQVEFAEKAAAAECLAEAVNAAVALPPRQQRATLCFLWEQVDDLLQLLETFEDHDLDAAMAQWPEEKAEKVLLKASLSPARRNMDQYMREYASTGVL